MLECWQRRDTHHFFWADATIFRKSGFKEAPPTRKPSMSLHVASSSEFDAETEPP